MGAVLAVQLWRKDAENFSQIAMRFSRAKWADLGGSTRHTTLILCKSKNNVSGMRSLRLDPTTRRIGRLTNHQPITFLPGLMRFQASSAVSTKAEQLKVVFADGAGVAQVLPSRQSDVQKSRPKRSTGTRAMRSVWISVSVSNNSSSVPNPPGKTATAAARIKKVHLANGEVVKIEAELWTDITVRRLLMRQDDVQPDRRRRRLRRRPGCRPPSRPGHRR